MTYRRGFHRLYAVLTVVWIASALIALPSSRLKFWIPEPTVFVDQSTGERLTPPAGYHPEPIDRYKKAIGPSQTERLLWLMEVLALPPAAGYLLLFQIVPWVYRGFGTGTQT